MYSVYSVFSVATRIFFSNGQDFEGVGAAEDAHFVAQGEQDAVAAGDQAGLLDAFEGEAGNFCGAVIAGGEEQG